MAKDNVFAASLEPLFPEVPLPEVQPALPDAVVPDGDEASDAPSLLRDAGGETARWPGHTAMREQTRADQCRRRTTQGFIRSQALVFALAASTPAAACTDPATVAENQLCSAGGGARCVGIGANNMTLSEPMIAAPHEANVARDGNIAILEEYEAAVKKDSIEAFRLFILRHPDHPNVVLAQAHIRRLGG